MSRLTKMDLKEAFAFGISRGVDFADDMWNEDHYDEYCEDIFLEEILEIELDNRISDVTFHEGVRTYLTCPVSIYMQDDNPDLDRKLDENILWGEYENGLFVGIKEVFDERTGW